MTAALEAPLTYLTVDTLAAGVGASQVLAYVERLAERGVEVRLHTFEQEEAPSTIQRRIRAADIHWTPHRFGRLGATGGLQRVLVGAAALRGAELVHARSDLAAASALLARRRRWIWDIRSFWPDELIELGRLRTGSPEERVLRFVERQAARRCSGAVTLAAAAVPVLAERHGGRMAECTRVITTCVDLERFPLEPLPPTPLRFMLSGTLNAAYDVPAMLRLVARSSERRATELLALVPGASPWDQALAAAGAMRTRAAPAEMPGHLRNCHVGLSVWRVGMGTSLKAAMPTKLGELLATGRPVVVNPGLGDMDEILRRHRCGVVLSDTDPRSLDEALDQLDELLEDADTPLRCRAAAEAHFDLDQGVDTLLSIYRKALA